METLGKVNNVTKEFEWEIEDIFSVLGKGEKTYTGPLFSFAGESWYMSLEVRKPKVETNDNSVGNVSVFLYRKKSGSPITLGWSLGVKSFEEKIAYERQFSHVFENKDGFGYTNFLKSSALVERKTELVPSGYLTLVCTMEYCSKSIDKTGNAVKVKCCHCKIDFVAAFLSSHEKKCMYRPRITCPTCSDTIAVKEWLDHECSSARIEATEKLIDDLKEILQGEEHSDVTIKVKHKEFKLHRNILTGRNPYFKSMFSTEMKEKITGIVSINDCDPDIFHTFIYFVYTGKIRKLSEDNVCALYEIADKYQEEQLKAECLTFIKNKISVDSFSDFTVFALKYEQKELLKVATELFCKKTKEIIESVKWQTFMAEYPTQANELYIKPFVLNAK